MPGPLRWCPCSDTDALPSRPLSHGRLHTGVTVCEAEWKTQPLRASGTLASMSPTLCCSEMQPPCARAEIRLITLPAPLFSCFLQDSAPIYWYFHIILISYKPNSQKTNRKLKGFLGIRELVSNPPARSQFREDKQRVCIKNENSFPEVYREEQVSSEKPRPT